METLILSLAALATAALSATFGMAGGLVLLGVYTALLPVPTAMVLHGATQLVANGGRAWLLRGHVHRNVLVYAVGAGAAWLLLRGVAWSPDAATVLIGVGAIPFLTLALPKVAALDFAHRRGATLAGALVAGTQLAFGVAGPLLDVFFVGGALDRKQVVASKAATQVFSHALKVVFFLPLVDPGKIVAPALTSALAAVVGTWMGGALLERMGEDTFRRWTRRLVLAVGAVYLVRGLCLL
jgi:uncharacterized membrane protein YfcA